MSDSVLDRLVALLDRSLQFDGNVVEAPIALLWPDAAREWEAAFEVVRSARRLVRLGSYDPEAQVGPAYWVRCVVAGTVRLDGPQGTSIIYLPGRARDDLRNVSSDDHALAPLASLQHRAQWFSHPNGKDWTVRALFGHKERGLGLSVAADDATAKALIGSLPQLLRQSMSRLEGRHLDAAFLNALLNPDPVRLLLSWLDEPKDLEASLSEPAWKAFVQQCKSDYGFDPLLHGVIEGGRRLGTAEGAWTNVWLRFRESPAEYPNIPSRLREAQPSVLILPNPGAWPTPAADAEDTLRDVLSKLKGAAPEHARASVLALENEHKVRRAYVWADLGWTPLALALEHLAEVARGTASAAPTSSVDAIAQWYAGLGWQVDRAVLRTLDEVDRKADIDAVSAVLEAVYRPWLQGTAVAMQETIGPAANAGTYAPTPAPSLSAGEVVMFIDGLRLDVAHLLADRLEGATAEVTLEAGLAALPTVTQTAKPAVVPIDQTLLAPGAGLAARRAPDGPAAGVQVLRQLLAASGIQVLSADDTGDPAGRAWTETGELDHRGHDLGTRLAHEVEAEVQKIARRIQELLQAGWSKVTVVTDHGWLLLPSGLPKNENLPVAATETKKGRCARVKEGGIVDVATVPWHWDKNVRIAVATGITCFEANQTYEHGGVSPQECVVPRLVVSLPAGKAPSNAEITSVKWKGLTLVVEFSALPDGVTVDLRRSAGDAASSVADMARVTGGSGKVILLVEDEDLEGQAVHLVVVGSDGTVLLQRDMHVGRNR